MVVTLYLNIYNIIRINIGVNSEEQSICFLLHVHCRDNLLKLSVFFDSLSTTLISTDASYSFSDIAGIISNMMQLRIGMGGGVLHRRKHL